VAGTGDGDSYADVIVGARVYAAGPIHGGASFVFLGSTAGVANGTPASADFVVDSGQAGAQFGTSVAAAGDVDGDGFSDVIVSNVDTGPIHWACQID
jgi:hypothetical protein